MSLDSHNECFKIILQYQEFLNRSLDPHVSGHIHFHFHFIAQNYETLATHQIDPNSFVGPLYELCYQPPTYQIIKEPSADGIIVGASVYEHMGQVARM